MAHGSGIPDLIHSQVADILLASGNWQRTFQVPIGVVSGICKGYIGIMEDTI